MFIVKEDGTVEMTAGDTGAIDVEAVLTGGEWGEDDRAVFTIRNTRGDEVMYRIYEMEIDGGTGTFTIAFRNQDTDSLPRGMYYWDVRYVIDPVYNADETRIVDGAQVITPVENIGITITKAATEV